MNIRKVVGLFIGTAALLLSACSTAVSETLPTSGDPLQVEPTVTSTPMSFEEVERYFIAKADMSLILPEGWEAGILDLDYGTDYEFTAGPFVQNSSPRSGRLIVSNLEAVPDRDAAIDIICQVECASVELIEDVALNYVGGVPVQRALISYDDQEVREWYFVQYNGKMVFFTLYDPETGVTDPVILNSIRFGDLLPEGDIPGAAIYARDMLAQVLHVPVIDVRVVSITYMDWESPCLGIPYPDVLCIQMITSGYRVVLETNGQQYVYHTNEFGTDIRLAEAPAPSVDNPIVEWTGSEDFCKTSIIGLDSIAAGVCYIAQITVPLNETRANEAAFYGETYAPFEADTAAGHVVFNGNGSTVASEAEQRAIAEWARLVSLEAESGHISATGGLAIHWQEEGGLTGVCHQVNIGIDGQVNTVFCDQETPVLGTARLRPEQLEQMYNWIDTYAAFTYSDDSQLAADGLAVLVTFDGRGEVQADEAVQLEIADFAAGVFSLYTP